VTTTDCIFCAISSKARPTPLVYEDTQVVAFEDAHPKAATHLLVVPKRHIEHLGTADAADRLALEALLPAVTAIVRARGLPGFKLIVNNGSDYGQSVFHLHLHLLSGQLTAGALQSL
jgi:histidine triad (HIT) family protein